MTAPGRNRRAAPRPARASPSPLQIARVGDVPTGPENPPPWQLGWSPPVNPPAGPGESGHVRESGQFGPLSTPMKQNRYYRSIRTREEPARNRRKVSNTLKTRRSVPASCIRAPTLAVCPSTMTSRRNPGRGARNPYRRAGQDPWLPRQMRRSPVESTRPRLAGSRAACPACLPAQALASHRAGLSNRRLSDTPACSGHGPGRAAGSGQALRDRAFDGDQVGSGLAANGLLSAQATRWRQALSADRGTGRGGPGAGRIDPGHDAGGDRGPSGERGGMALVE